MISLGSALISVAGLAISAGYQDSHSGLTTAVARWIGRRRKQRKDQSRFQGQVNGSLEEVKTDDPRASLRSTLTVTPSVRERRMRMRSRSKQQHAKGGQKAAEVSARVRKIVSHFSTVKAHLY